MKCKQCGINEAQKYSEFTSGEFCSLKCSKSFSTTKNRDEISRKKSEALKERFKTHPHSSTGRIQSKESRKKQSDALKETYKRKHAETKENLPFIEWNKTLQVRHIFEKFGNVCQECGYSHTAENGKGPFEIHHIDGNHDNNEELNLTVLCLNCHWKTPNWRFRGKVRTAEAIQKAKETIQRKKLQLVA